MDAERFLGEIGRACRRIRHLSRVTDERAAPWAREAVDQLASCARELRTASDQLKVLRGELASVSAELEHERRQARTFFMSAPHACVLSDLGGTISAANRVAGDLLGLAESRLAGKPLATFVEPDDRWRFEDWVRRLWEAARDASLCAECGGRFEFRLRTFSHDRSFPCLVIAAPVSERDCAIRSIRWMIADLSDHRGAATAQRLQEEIRRRDEFLAMLGHELRNPLAAVALAADVLDETSEREGRNRRTCRILKRNTEQLRRLVDDLMDVSMVTRGKVALASEFIDLRDVVAAAVETMQPILSARRHQLGVVRPSHQVPVRGEAARLTQVVTNLLDNSAKYTPIGGHLELVLSRQTDRAIIEVKDDGIGIPPHMLERVFEPFEQIPGGAGEVAGHGRGLGLGLALVNQLVQLHGGSVHARSPGEGKGSTLVVDLPLVTAETRDSPSVPNERPAAATQVSRLLVIDDHEDAADLLALVLRERGYQVDVAHDGQGGIDQARNGGYDAALVDLGLPDLDGYQVCRQLRQDAPSLRLFALTGYGDDRARAEAAQAGFDGFLLKPVHAELIESTLKNATVT